MHSKVTEMSACPALNSKIIFLLNSLAINGRRFYATLMNANLKHVVMFCLVVGF